MSIYDNAGVVQIPSGTKASKLYSVLPANGEGDFNATRGSSATRVNKDGLIESVATNVPRLDYPLIDGVVKDCPALLLEPSRTNTFQRSEEFDNAYWNTSRIETPSKDGVVDPTGGLDAYTLEMSTGQTSGGGVYRTGISVSESNSFSVFAKKGNIDYLVLGDGGLDSSQNAVYFNLSNGTVGTEYQNAVGEMQDFGNGWYRCTMKYTETSSDPKFIYVTNVNGQTANSVTGGDYIYIWGAQYEQASYPTSYIPTSASTATRSADVCNGSGTSAEFNDSEGVLFAEIAAFDTNVGNARIGIDKASSGSSERVGIGFTTTTNQIQAFISRSSTQANILSTVSDITTFNKIAFKYKVNDFSLFINGTKVGTDTSGNVPIGLDELSFDDNDGVIFYGKSKQLSTFKTALTDSELETLTSWDSFNAMAKGQLYTIE